MNLDQTSGSRQITNAASSSSGSVDRTPADDSIALSNTSDLVQQALTSGTDARSARILQLRHLIETNQYQVDAAAVAERSDRRASRGRLVRGMADSVGHERCGGTPESR